MKASATLHYTPFRPLQPYGSSMSAGGSQINLIEELLDAGEWNKAREQASQLIGLALEGLHYLQTCSKFSRDQWYSYLPRTQIRYDRILLRAIATLGYIGWSAYALCHILSSSEPTTAQPSDALFVKVLFIAFTAMSYTALFVQSSPMVYYVYLSFPIFFWHRILQSINHWLSRSFSSDLQARGKGNPFLWKMIYSGFIVIALETMVVSEDSTFESG
jgi:phosphatidylinositol glycan class N